jgi:hypothetical protein
VLQPSTRMAVGQKIVLRGAGAESCAGMKKQRFVCVHYYRRRQRRRYLGTQYNSACSIGNFSKSGPEQLMHQSLSRRSGGGEGGG